MFAKLCCLGGHSLRKHRMCERHHSYLACSKILAYDELNANFFSTRQRLQMHLKGNLDFPSKIIMSSDEKRSFVKYVALQKHFTAVL